MRSCRRPKNGAEYQADADKVTVVGDEKVRFRRQPESPQKAL